MKHWLQVPEKSLCCGIVVGLVLAGGLLVGWVPVQAGTFVDGGHWELRLAWQGLETVFVAARF